MEVYKVPLRLEPKPEGGFTVTSPAVQGLVTEGNTVAEALAHAAEALDLVLEDYDAEGTLRAAVRELGLAWQAFKEA
jgi:antitoxin HicB